MRKRAIAATMLLTAAMAFTSCAKLYEEETTETLSCQYGGEVTIQSMELSGSRPRPEAASVLKITSVRIAFAL